MRKFSSRVWTLVLFASNACSSEPLASSPGIAKTASTMSASSASQASGAASETAPPALSVPGSSASSAGALTISQLPTDVPASSTPTNALNTATPSSVSAATASPSTIASTSATAPGSSGPTPTAAPQFLLGADISSVQESQVRFTDTDGQNKSIFTLLASHGFNAIRLKTFVEPSAAYGYSSQENGCSGLSEAYGDKSHVIDFGKQAKAAGMQFLLDFHYSDTWADPGNQIIPEQWRSASTIVELAGYVKAYTADVIQEAVSAGARPDMVQIGNEITPGMLMHVPGEATDCWGNNPSSAPIGGSTSNWDNLATLLKAGIEGVREVDSGIQIMLHVENTDDLEGVRWWVDNARSRGVEFDVLGLSCYSAFQGEPSVWQETFETMAGEHPDLKFVIAEYNPNRTEANQIVKNLPNGQGLGTFFWEPTRSGEWGEALFTWEGGTAIAKAAEFAEFDQLRIELGL
jgi:arabinogalactan endo-1,4-beta-galactosidase